MIKKYEEITHVMIHEMKGGTGDVEKIDSVVAGEYDSPAKVVARLILRPGVSIGYHVHNGEEEIMTILAGNGVYTVDGTETLVTAGDITVCRDGEGHSIRNASETENLELFALVNGIVK